MLDGERIGFGRFGDRHALVAVHEVGTVTSRTHRDHSSIGRLAEEQRVDGGEVELVRRVGHVFKAQSRELTTRVGVAEVELT